MQPSWSVFVHCSTTYNENVFGAEGRRLDEVMIVLMLMWLEMNPGEIPFQLKLFTQIAIEILTVKSTDIFSTSFEQGIIPPYTQILWPN